MNQALRTAELRLNNLELPAVSGMTHPYPWTYRPFLLTAELTFTIRGEQVSFEEKAMVVHNPDDTGHNDQAMLWPLYEMRDAHAMPELAARMPPRRATDRDDAVGGDGWLIPNLWFNLFVDGISLFVRQNVCDLPPPEPPARPPNSPARCDEKINDNDTDPTGSAEFLDELIVADISAHHARCFRVRTSASDAPVETWGECKSILGHNSHHTGTMMDVRYVSANGISYPRGNIADDTGLSGAGFDNRYFELWQASADPRVDPAVDQDANTAGFQNSRHSARVKLREWVLRNRHFLEWLRDHSRGNADADTPLRRVLIGKKKDCVGYVMTDADGQEFIEERCAPLIKDIMVTGVLQAESGDSTPAANDQYPYDDPNRQDDDNPGPWDHGMEVVAAVGHEDHMHLEFRNPALARD